MKRKPNGYGSIQKLSGNRLRPYGVYGPRLLIDGERHRECIGYFETYEEADYALAKWNRTRGTKMNYSLQELYEEWSESAYTELSANTVSSYKAAWGKLSSLYSFKVRDLRTGHFQRIVDVYRKKGRSYSCLHDIKVLVGLIEKYAMQYDIIEKNYAEYIELPPNATEEKEIFTKEQYATLVEAAQNDFMASRLIVIMCNMGWRISEMLLLTPGDYDPVAKIFKGGIKTVNGKNRLVPVGPDIQPYVDELLARNGPRLVCREQPHGKRKERWIELVPMSAAYFRKKLFKPTLDALNIKQTNGKDYTPNVTRHTFASRCRKQGVDPLVTKKLMGHSLKADVTEKTYTHIDVDMLNTAIEMIQDKKAQK